MSEHVVDIGTPKKIGIGVAAVIISAALFAVAFVGVSQFKPDALGQHLWLTSTVLTLLAMIVGITATYASNPLDHPDEPSSLVTLVFETSGIISFFSGIALYLLANLRTWNL